MLLLADAVEGLVNVSFSTGALWTALGVGLPTILASLGTATWRLLAWFLGRLDKQEAAHAAALQRIIGDNDAKVEKMTTQFTLALKEERARSEKSENRSLEIHGRAVEVIEGVRDALRGLSQRIEHLERGIEDFERSGEHRPIPQQQQQPQARKRGSGEHRPLPD